MKPTMGNRIAIGSGLTLMALGTALQLAGHPHADPGQCQYLGTNYNVQYDCTQYQPWLPYGTADNPPAGGVPQDCTGVRMHNIGCS